MNYQSRNYDAVKGEKRKAIESLPSVKNLFKVEQKINHFAKEILTIFPGSYKEWKDGQHIILRDKENGDYFHEPLYCTTYNDTFYFDELTKNKINSNKTWCLMFTYSQCPDKCRIVDYRHNEAYEIIKLNDGFLCNGVKKEYRNFIDFMNHDISLKFTMTSLVSQMIKIKAPIARKLGNIKSNQNSAAQSKRGTKIWCKLVSDYAEAGPREETMNAKGVYEVAKKWGYACSFKQFTNVLNKIGHFKFNSHSANLEIIKLQPVADKGSSLPAIISNIYNREDKKVEENLNLDEFIIIVGSELPQQPAAVGLIIEKGVEAENPVDNDKSDKNFIFDDRLFTEYQLNELGFEDEYACWHLEEKQAVDLLIGFKMWLLKRNKK